MNIDSARKIIIDIVKVLQSWEQIALKNKLQFSEFEKNILDKNIFQPLNNYAKDFIKINTISKKNKAPSSLMIKVKLKFLFIIVFYIFLKEKLCYQI